MSYFLYSFLTILLSPFINIYIFFRLFWGKEEFGRLKEKFGRPTKKRPKGDIIWVQAVSVGESIVALTLIDKLIEQNKDATVLLTTTTRTSANLIESKNKSPKIIHQYTPIDKIHTILKFLDYWRPIALINIESEIWPNVIVRTHKTGAKVIIATAKMSDRSFERWKKFDRMRRVIFSNIDICYPQSEEDSKKLQVLGVKKTISLGNLKLATPKASINQKYYESLKEGIGDRPTIVFASLHYEELDFAYQIHKELKQKYPNLLSFFTLRHGKYTSPVKAFLEKRGENVVRKSQKERIKKDTTIYIYDEMGEMGCFYEISDVVIMCGSLVDGIGGHNPIEVAKFDCAIITGPFIAGNKILFDEMLKYDACIVNKNNDVVNEMIKEVGDLINNKERREKLKLNALKTTEKYSHIASEIARSITETINGE
ncbi:MAG: hypothetical protein LBH46_00885 [Rickettsiales bacterium]|jgi:3-deoxy-D-manno-octulosonic-acid transferase|nr:hypothetical protein [Rickettsiales bacterium]